MVKDIVAKEESVCSDWNTNKGPSKKVSSDNLLFIFKCFYFISYNILANAFPRISAFRDFILKLLLGAGFSLLLFGFAFSIKGVIELFTF